MSLSELAGRIGAELRGNGAHEVIACAGLEEAESHQLSFLANRKYTKLLHTTRAGAVILGPADVKYTDGQNLLVTDDPYFGFRQAVVALHGFRRQPSGGVSPQAYVDPAATIGRKCTIEPFVFIAANARIGDRCVLYPHCYVGDDVVIGADCILYPNVTIYDGCVLGDRVTLHSGTVVGQDGFGYATHDATHHKIPPAGNVVIQDDVEMGANCAIDRATVGSTRLGIGSKLSDLVAIGHGADVGSHNLIVAQVGLAGSVQTGTHVSMGGQAGVAGHLKIGDEAQLAAQAGVMTDIPAYTKAGGTPAMGFARTKRMILAARKLPALIQEFRKLQRRVISLEQARRDASKVANSEKAKAGNRKETS